MFEIIQALELDTIREHRSNPKEWPFLRNMSKKKPRFINKTIHLKLSHSDPIHNSIVFTSADLIMKNACRYDGCASYAKKTINAKQRNINANTLSAVFHLKL